MAVILAIPWVIGNKQQHCNEQPAFATLAHSLAVSFCARRR